MTAIETLVPVAVLGTSRRDLDLASLPAALAEGLAEEPPARALLAAAARAAIIDRIALPVGAAGDDPAPPPETCAAPRSPSYAGSLAQALGGQRWAAVVETLRHLAATDQRVPIGALHSLLELAVTRRDVRSALGPVLGARGRWLAARNPRWGFDEWAEPDLADESVWRHGPVAGRVAWLARCRVEDPDRARAVLERALPDADAAARAALLGALRTSLGPADEPLLEGALDDRGRGVREVARDLLPLLPQSAFVVRMRRRVRACVELHRGRRWEVDLGRLDGAAARDGIDVTVERSPGVSAARGIRALVGGVPLAVWAEEYAMPAEELVGIRYGPVELGPLPGLRDAALRERDPAVATAVLEDRQWRADPDLVSCLVPDGGEGDPGAIDRLLARRVRILGPTLSVPELRVHGFGAETAGVLLRWLADSRSFGNRASVLAALGDCGPIGSDPDLAAPLRDLAAQLTGADRNRAFDAAMTINLRRSLRAEAQPTSPDPTNPDPTNPDPTSPDESQ